MSNQNWTHTGQVTVYAFNGKVRIFPSLEDAVRAIGRYHHIEALADRPLGYSVDTILKKGAYYGTWAYAQYYQGSIFGGDPFVIHDELGLRIPAWKVKEAYANLPFKDKVWRRNAAKDFAFRNGPVPGIHCYRGGGGYFRNPATRNEKAANSGYEEYLDELDDEIGMRPKGRIRDLPTNYDDISRSRGWHTRSWKEYRRHQYR